MDENKEVVFDRAPEYYDWDGYNTYATTKAIAIVFSITFGEASKYGLDDMTDEDYDEVMRVRKEPEKNRIKFTSQESLPYI